MHIDTVYVQAVSIVDVFIVCVPPSRDSVKRRSSDTLHEPIPSSDPIHSLYPGLPDTLQEGQVGTC